MLHDGKKKLILFSFKFIYFKPVNNMSISNYIFSSSIRIAPMIMFSI